jgi:hypothetical protein
MPDLNVNFEFQRLRCIDEGDGAGSAEPYLWTVFFKLDADTLATGNPTTRTHTSDRANLPNQDVDAGEIQAIPAAVGRFATKLKALPVAGRENESRIGCIFALMEEDDTPSHAMHKGHLKFNAQVTAKVRDFMLQALGGTVPTQQEINAAAAQVSSAVAKAVKDDLKWYEVLRNHDDVIGNGVLIFSLADLLKAGTAGISFARRFQNEGDWEISGRIVGSPA